MKVIAFASPLGIKEQKYKIESYSQLAIDVKFLVTCWESKNKNTKLKAIHNWRLFSKNATMLGIKEQKYKIESYSQLAITSPSLPPGWESKNKNTKLKAIHN